MQIFRHLKRCSETVSFFNILTSKCASRYSGVQFFNISTSKSAPNPADFWNFQFKMCFLPQPRAIFQHLNFKKCSEPAMFRTFLLENVRLATAACNFSTSQLQKMLRDRQFFGIFTSKCASRPAALTSLLFDSPDTRIIGKTQRFATSLTCGAGESSFF